MTSARERYESVYLMPLKIVPFEEFEDHRRDKPDDPPGKWVTPCPRCGSRMYPPPGCDECEYGWVIVDPIETREACKVQDHEWKMEFDAGSFHVVCIDPHTPQEQEAMYRHQGHIPGCLEDSELGEMIAGTIRFKADIVVEGGSYEYPNDVDVWYEFTEVELEA